ncbi:hypothetical protein [Escherichia coli]|uniref:hypothetical protein n=1 Tax=Escherichia coli TaxID=562 RepID=UPI002B153F31|nr:hypothetical protein [Escherichia coli]MEE4473644.1 hypothetical protein [Escherichia coli]HEP0118313.1 hypothetical protein [Escherichia coli]
MKMMVFLLVVMVAYMAFFRDDGAAAYTAQRVNEQDKILVELQSLNDPHVSDFVRDWRYYAPTPSPEQLTELRLIQQNIRNDKSVAEKYTLEWQNKNGFCSKVEGVFGKIECTPGL